MAAALQEIRETAEGFRESSEESITAVEEARAAALQEIKSFPGSAVVAFNLAECPSGWREHDKAAGRFIVGTGSHSVFDQYGLELAELKLGDEGGSRTHRLTVLEMPAHTHRYTSSSGHNSPQHVDYSSDEFGYRNRNPETDPIGGDQPHNNMPPYVALRFCEFVSETLP